MVARFAKSAASFVWLRAMAGIARDIELYNSAFRLAWKHVSEHQREQSDIAQRLHNSIRRQIKKGAISDLLIASEALNELTK
jgi:hypothetical protein